jgi:cell division cycle 14
MGAYMIMELGCTAEQAWGKFRTISSKFLPFNDAGKVPTRFELRADNCLKAIERAKLKGWYNSKTFDSDTYHKLNKLDEGDLNWIIPGKILALSSHSINKAEGLESHFFCPVFKKVGIKAIVRLNERLYRDTEMSEHGIRIYPMELTDGNNPTKL